MKITKEQQEILKSLSGINNQIVFEKDRISVSTNSKEMKCYWNHDMDIGDDQTFGCSNTTKLLTIIKSMNDPDIQIKDTHLMIKKGKNKAKIINADEDCIEKATDYNTLFNEKIDDYGIEFILTKEELDTLKSMCNTLSSSHFKIENDTIISFDPFSSAEDSFSIQLNIDENEKLPYMAFLKTQFLNLYSDNYEVKEAKIGDKSILVLKGKEKELLYTLIPVKVD
jgi:hypothetical protein